MATSRAIILLLALVVSSCSLQWTQAATDCSSTLEALSGCLPFLTNTSAPNKACCTPLETVLTTPSSFDCLCAQATSTSTSNAAFKNALLLPERCNLTTTVSTSNCTQSPSSSNSTAPSPNAGFMGASSLSYVTALALLWGLASLLI